MNEAIRDDVHAQVVGFAHRLQSTFDPSRYPRLADGACFDANLAALHEEFAALQRMFHDYLLASWSEETATTLRATGQAGFGPPQDAHSGEPSP